MTITPSYVGEPECNGAIERFIRTLKEQCLYLHRFQSLEEARRIIGEFIRHYNREWLIERLGHRTPVPARRGDPEGSMNRIGQKIEGRIWLQTRLLDGGRYLGIPRNGGFQHSLGVQGTRSGTRLLGGPIGRGAA